MARKKIEHGKLTDKKGFSTSSSQMFMDERLQIYDSNEIPDPQVLEAILNRESKLDRMSDKM